MKKRKKQLRLNSNGIGEKGSKVTADKFTAILKPNLVELAAMAVVARRLKVSFVSLNVLTWNYTGSFWESAEGLRDVNEETREYVIANAYLNAAQHFAGDLLSEIGGVFPVVGYNNGKSIEEIAAPSLPFQKLDNIDNTMFADLREIHEKEGVADIAGNMMRRYMALEIWEFLCNPVIWMSVAWMAHSMNRKTHVTYFEIDEILHRNMAIYEESVQPFKGPFQLEGLYEMNENSDEH